MIEQEAIYILRLILPLFLDMGKNFILIYAVVLMFRRITHI